MTLLWLRSVTVLVLVLICSLDCHPLYAEDCNGNRQGDDVDVSSGASEDCNLDLVPDECQPLPIRFSVVPSFASSGVPKSVTTGDFNGDGLEDFASANVTDGGRETATVTIFLSLGGEFVQEVFPAARELPSSLDAGDLDGDGDQDLVLVSSTSVFGLLGAGDGTFGAPFAIDGDTPLDEVLVRDVSGDGALDLIASRSRNDTVYVYTNDGRGGYGRPDEFIVGDLPGSVDLGDVDGDGDLDIVAANRRSAFVSLLINEGGSFAGIEVPTVDPKPQEVAVADLNDDGLADLAVGTTKALEILISSGDGTFEVAALFPFDGPAPRSATQVVAEDVDGDGDSDVVVASVNIDGIFVILNGGNGTFAALPPTGLSERPSDLVLGDWNADGLPDVLTAMENAGVVTLLLSGGLRDFSRLKSTVGVGGEPHGAAIGDMDGDGDVDVITSNGNCNTVTLLANDGRGDLTPRLVGRIPGFLHSMAAGDFDRDGDLDIVIADLSGSNLHVRANDGRGNFTPQRTQRVPGGPFYVTTADLDGDDYPDILTTARKLVILFNEREQPDGRFAFAGSTAGSQFESVDAGIGPVGVTAGDLDKDGNQDVAVANYNSSELTVHMGEGGRAFSAAVVYDVVTPRFVTTFDFNRDGHLDLATVDEQPRQVSVFRNRGDGTFGVPAEFPLRQTPYSMVAADLNRDGLDDLATANQTPNTLSVLLNLGDETMSAPLNFLVGVDPRFVLPGDLDDDGSVDLVTTNHTSSDLTLLLSRGTSTGRIAPFLETICTGADFFMLSIPSGGRGLVERLTKYIVPAELDDPELLPPLFQNVGQFPLHQEFLAAFFADRFPLASYEELVGRRATRKYFIGVINLLRTETGPLYGFNVITSFQSDPTELPRLEEVRRVYETLSETFTLRPLAYAPDSLATEEDAATWADPGFPVHLGVAGPSFDYEAYTSGVTYGFVRLLTQAEFDEANRTGLVSSQDILVLDRAPRDIEGVVSGVITGEVQGELGHLAIRTSRRGTPNAFVKDALEELAPFDGALVRLEVKESEYIVESATLEAAREWWETRRPRLAEPPEIDPEFSELATLEEIAALDVEGAPAPESRFGGKASNFARLQAVLTGDMSRYRESGFAIPVRYYLEFMESTEMRSAIDRSRFVTYKEYIEELVTDDEFNRNSTYRFQTLDDLRDHMRDSGKVPGALVQTIALRIGEVFGSTTERVRFRSSSNAEDSLEFNGAGLYDSTSACAADDLDLDRIGPSRCDAARDDERGIERALRRVWSSLWNFRAFEERAYYGIPGELTAMAVLVSRAFPDERANGVAFTGSPANPLDHRYVVSVQVGDHSVVLPEPGEIPEKDLVWMEDGQLVEIERSVASALVEDGSVVLTDDQLEELGLFLWHIDQNFPLDLGDHAREEVLLDVEFKIDVDGSLAVKQVRPFLLSAPVPPTPSFTLEVPPGTTLCGVFVPFRRPREAYEFKSRIEFSTTAMELPTHSEWFRGQLFDGLVLGPEQEFAAANELGVFHITRLPRGEATVYRFDYEQRFELAGESFLLKLSNLRFQASGEVPLQRSLVVDEEFVTRELTLEGNSGLVTYSSCTYETLPLWEIEVALEGDSSIRLIERHEIPPTVNDTGPASLVRAEVKLAGVERTITDYWRLVYAADRHNLNVRYWIVFESPLTIPGIEEPVLVVEIIAPEPDLGVTEEAHYLGANFEVIASPSIVQFQRQGIAGPVATPFRRGDVDGDGEINLTDAVGLLGQLFRGGEASSCLETVDANDDGAANLSDAVAILGHLFGGAGELPPPFGACGEDPTPDGLSCDRYDTCNG